MNITNNSDSLSESNYDIYHLIHKNIQSNPSICFYLSNDDQNTVLDIINSISLRESQLILSNEDIHQILNRIKQINTFYPIAIKHSRTIASVFEKALTYAQQRTQALEKEALEIFGEAVQDTIITLQKLKDITKNEENAAKTEEMLLICLLKTLPLEERKSAFSSAYEILKNFLPRPKKQILLYRILNIPREYLLELPHLAQCLLEHVILPKDKLQLLSLMLDLPHEQRKTLVSYVNAEPESKCTLGKMYMINAFLVMLKAERVKVLKLCEPLLKNIPCCHAKALLIERLNATPTDQHNKLLNSIQSLLLQNHGLKEKIVSENVTRVHLTRKWCPYVSNMEALLANV